MLSLEIFGAWVAVLLTLCILSFLYADNPFYKAAEHIFVGVSAGYVFALTWWDQVWPNLFGRLFPNYVDAGFEFNIIYIIPLILGIFMLCRLIPSLSWLARISIGYIVGIGCVIGAIAGLGLQWWSSTIEYPIIIMKKKFCHLHIEIYLYKNIMIIFINDNYIKILISN